MMRRPGLLFCFLLAFLTQSFLIQSYLCQDDAAQLRSNEDCALIDTGFRPEVDGFSFENYGDDRKAEGLSSEELLRMFGDKVCSGIVDGKCVLTPAGRHWMEQVNRAMSVGHCEGFAVLSLLMYYGFINPDKFGGSNAHELNISNRNLQKEIAFWWTTQGLSPAIDDKVAGPSNVLNVLTDAFSQGDDAFDSWTIGIYKEDGSDGHAVTPYAVKDSGNGLYDVLVYDNNFPNQKRTLTIDKNNNTFSYESSVNPLERSDCYFGSNIEITPTSSRLVEQKCPFCRDSGAGKLNASSSSAELNATESAKMVQVWLNGSARLLLTDEQGKRTGWTAENRHVNEIPGARVQRFLYENPEDEYAVQPLYLLPDGTNFTATIDGTRLKTGSYQELLVIGNGYELNVEDIWLDPGECDSVEITKYGSDYFGLAYATNYTESPDLDIGLETEDADWEFIVKGAEIESGGSVNVDLDYDSGDFILHTFGNEETGWYQIMVIRTDDNETQVFANDEISMSPNETMYVNFLDWKGDGDSMPLDFDLNDDGIIDKSIRAADASDFYSDPYADWEADDMESDEVN